MANSMRLHAEGPMERAHAVRRAARQAWFDLEDSRALRVWLDSRPRPARDFAMGDLVAYWRKGRGEKHSRWHGRGVIVACDKGIL